MWFAQWIIGSPWPRGRPRGLEASELLELGFLYFKIPLAKQTFVKTGLLHLRIEDSPIALLATLLHAGSIFFSQIQRTSRLSCILSEPQRHALESQAAREDSALVSALPGGLACRFSCKLVALPKPTVQPHARTSRHHLQASSLPQRGRNAGTRTPHGTPNHPKRSTPFADLQMLVFFGRQTRLNIGLGSNGSFEFLNS